MPWWRCSPALIGKGSRAGEGAGRPGGPRHARRVGDRPAGARAVRLRFDPTGDRLAAVLCRCAECRAGTATRWEPTVAGPVPTPPSWFRGFSRLVAESAEPVYLGEPTGFVVEVENGFPFYHAGDTNVFGDMRLIRDLYRPEVALLPIGAYRPRWFMSPLHVGPDEAVKAHLDLRADTSIAPAAILGGDLLSLFSVEITFAE